MDLLLIGVIGAVAVVTVTALAPRVGVSAPLLLVALGVVISFARTEPGAAEALAARPSVVRRSLAVIGRTRA